MFQCQDGLKNGFPNIPEVRRMLLWRFVCSELNSHWFHAAILQVALTCRRKIGLRCKRIFDFRESASRQERQWKYRRELLRWFGWKIRRRRNEELHEMPDNGVSGARWTFQKIWSKASYLSNPKLLWIGCCFVIAVCSFMKRWCNCCWISDGSTDERCVKNENAWTP